MRVLATVATFVFVLIVTAAAVFVAALVLAGPHGGLLPSSLQAATLVLAWVAVLGVPVLAACWVWRRLAPGRHGHRS